MIIRHATMADLDILDQIERMAQLRDAGILTEEEFTKKKTQLLEKL